MGTTTLKASGGDYTTIAAWQADNGGLVDKDLVTATEGVTLECYDEDYTAHSGGDSYTDEGISISGWTTNTTYFITIKCPSTEKHDGTPNATGFYWQHNNSSIGVLAIGAGQDLHLEDIDLRSYHVVNYRHTIAISGNDTNFLAERCVLRSEGASNANDIISTNQRRALGYMIIRNCLLFGNGSCDGWNTSNFSDGDMYNCTIADCATGIQNNSTGSGYQPKIVNTVTWNCTAFHSDAGSGYATGTGYNAASNYTTTAAPGSNNYTSDVVSGDFADTSTDDYHLAASSSLEDLGNDLSGLSSPYGFSDDIDAETRSGSWDIGMDELIAAGGYPMPLHHHYQVNIGSQ